MRRLHPDIHAKESCRYTVHEDDRVLELQPEEEDIETKGEEDWVLPLFGDGDLETSRVYGIYLVSFDPYGSQNCW